MIFQVEFVGQIRTHDDRLLSSDVFKDFVNRSFSVVVSSHAVVGGAYTTSPEAGIVQIVIDVEAPGTAKALEDGSAAIRSGFHAADVATPNWKIDWCKVQLSGDNVLQLI